MIKDKTPKTFFPWQFSIKINGPTYLLTTPLDIRSGKNVIIGIDLLPNSPPTVKVQAEILKDNITLLQGEGIFQRGTFGKLVLPQLPSNSFIGKYELKVEGFSENKMIFNNTTLLDFNSKSYSVFIETNSIFYKPGQEVKIRILTFSSDLKPYTSTIDIHIMDPRGNLLEQWLEEKAELGVVSNVFQLSDNPPLGDWSIKVKLHQQFHYQTFTVTHYVLPKFEVFLSTPMHYSLKMGLLEGTVTARYTYSRPIKGKLTVILHHNTFHQNKNNFSKDFEINGFSKFHFTELEVKKLVRYEEKNLENFKFNALLDVVAIVTEDLTGVSQNETSSVSVIDREYYSEFYNYPTVLKPTLNFTTYLKMRRYDGRDLTEKERRNEVSVTVTQSKMYLTDGMLNSMLDEEKNIELQQLSTYFIPENSEIKIEIPLYADTVHLKIKAEFLDSVNTIDVDDVFYSPNKMYLHIESTNQNLKVGEPFTTEIKSSTSVDAIKYLIVSRGEIVYFGLENSTSLTLIPQSSWTPEACLMVYHVMNDGTVLNDVTTLSINPDFENKISVSWNKRQANLSEKVSLKINVTEPNSLIGLSVLDKSVTLLGDRQEITTKRVSEELKGYNSIPPNRVTSPYQVFEKCNIGVFTDAILGKEDEYDTLRNVHFDSREDFQPSWHPVDFGGSRIRSNFPETWIWKNINSGRSTFLEMDTVVPDTITTWIAKAFVISENLGFGILETPVQLESFQPFFASLNLPSYVIRGEPFVLEVVVFNYLEEDTEVSVTFEPRDAFEIYLSYINATGPQQTVLVPSQDGKTVFFPVKPIQLGEISIMVKATSTLASDTVTQKLLVKAEGIEYSHSQTLLLELMNSKPQMISKSLNFTFPPDVVSGSEKAFITVVGNILGPTTASLESLVQLPYGCGEQNMVRFAPVVFIMEYLTKTGQPHELTPKLISYMKEGYQRELAYQRKDGSFSAFGNDDLVGSTWLSAFVLRCFLKARQFILVDPVVLHETLTWLLVHQKKSGAFWEPGRIIKTQLQGGDYSPVTLTAYIMSALIEYPGLLNSTQITAAVNYLESQMNEVTSDNYTLSLMTYALSLVGSNKAKEGLDLLNHRAEQNGDLRFWKSNIQRAQGWWQPNSVDIEVASYVLLSHVIQNRVSEGVAVMKWLSQQRNHLGGYSSTQDTVVALQAMTSFASKYLVSKPALHISVEGNQMDSPSFRINSENYMMLQSKQIDVGQDINITAHAEGIGFTLLQLHVIYNLRSDVSKRTRRSTASKDYFDLNVTVQDNMKNVNIFTLNICTRYSEIDSSSQTGMALLQVDLLSGFSLSPDAIVMKYPIKKVETVDDTVNIYLDSLNQTEFCLDIPAIRSSNVGYTQDAFVSIIDYYEPGRRAVKSFNSEVMKTLSPCSFCKNECSECLDNHATQLSNGQWFYLLLFILFVICL
ncbi:CD109 antigen-like isoform X2 [Hyla sarda]|uniref:CD109 antigen-like isoform X2 n=1 Tax=Hyla sarda TaxID=327740 RepID=UPI0024C212BE|nr:CD109 antigen-like isoform X2 [Hyla sarda]